MIQIADMSLAELIARAEAAGADFKAVHIPAPGPYVVKVTHNRYKVSKKGNDGFGVRVEVIQGPFEKKGFWTDFYLTPLKNNGEPNNAGVAIFFRNLAALGVPTEEFKTQGLTVEQLIKSNRLIGVVAEATVEDDDYNPDEVKSKVKSFKKLDGAGVVPSAPVQQAASAVPPPPVAVVPPPPVTFEAAAGAVAPPATEPDPF